MQRTPSSSKKCSLTKWYFAHGLCTWGGGREEGRTRKGELKGREGGGGDGGREGPERERDELYRNTF